MSFDKLRRALVLAVIDVCPHARVRASRLVRWVVGGGRPAGDRDAWEEVVAAASVVLLLDRVTHRVGDRDGGAGAGR